jgi:hypothetical protein
MMVLVILTNTALSLLSTFQTIFFSGLEKSTNCTLFIFFWWTAVFIEWLGLKNGPLTISPERITERRSEFEIKDDVLKFEK